MSSSETEVLQGANVIFHIGLGKTGSTYLQNCVFPFLDESILYNPKELSSIYSKIMRIHYNEDYKVVMEDREKLKKEVNEFLLSNKGKTVLISNEMVSTQGYGHYHEKGLELISCFFPDATILIFLREQESWVISMYRQSVQQGNFQDFTEFVYFEKDKNRNTYNTYQTGQLPKINIADVHFQTVVEDYLSAFGSDQVKVFHYEDLKKDRKGLLKKLGNVLNTDIVDAEHNRKVFYRSLSGLSIRIILAVFFVLKPFRYQLYYTPKMMLYRAPEYNRDNRFFKAFPWAKVRKLFQDKLDKFYYADLGFDQHCRRILSQYQEHFESNKKALRGLLSNLESGEKRADDRSKLSDNEGC